MKEKPILHFSKLNGSFLEPNIHYLKGTNALVLLNGGLKLRDTNKHLTTLFIMCGGQSQEEIDAKIRAQEIEIGLRNDKEVAAKEIKMLLLGIERLNQVPASPAKALFSSK